MTLTSLTAHELEKALSQGSLNADQVIGEYVSHAAAANDKTAAIIRFLSLPNSQLPLPIAIKDNICVKGELTTCGSRILEGFRPPYDAGVIERIKTAGLPIFATANMDEFAFGSSCETSAYGPTRNPWNLDCVPGGSSGGSAASVAAGQVVWSLGSDTGGSIRQPAAFCGVVGLKPTYGRVSRYGLIAFGSSLDQIGPFTRDVRDCARLLGIIAGFDQRDSTSVDRPVPDYVASLNGDIKGLRIGIPKEYFIDGIQPEVLAAVKAAVDVFRGLGAEVKEISLPHTKYSVATYYIVATAEASSNLARFDGVEYGLRRVPEKPRKNPLLDMYEATREAGFGDEVKRRVMLGTYVLSSGYYDAYYLRAQKVRTLIKGDFDKAFKDVDIIISPTAPTTAFKIGEKMNDPLSMYLSDIFTIPANLAGIPAMSIPCGFDRNKMPVGLQIMGKAFDEPTVLKAAYHYEQKTPWHKERALIQ